MATLLELQALFNNAELAQKVQSAVIIGANNLLTGTETQPETNWVAAAFSSPGAESRKALMAVLADNSGLSVAQITSASDAAIQSAVNDIIPTLVSAHNAV